MSTTVFEILGGVDLSGAYALCLFVGMMMMAGAMVLLVSMVDEMQAEDMNFSYEYEQDMLEASAFEMWTTEGAKSCNLWVSIHGLHNGIVTVSPRKIVMEEIVLPLEICVYEEEMWMFPIQWDEEDQIVIPNYWMELRAA